MSNIVKKLTNRLPFAPVVAALFAGTSAALMMATPIWMLEKWVAASGLSSIVSAAKAPLGFKARIVIVVAVALTVGLVTLIAMIPVGRKLNAGKTVRPFAPAAQTQTQGVTPFAPPQDQPAAQISDPGRYKQASAEGDFAFARAPIFADRELGAPFMSPEPEVAAVQDVPAPVASAPEWPPVAAEAPVFAPHMSASVAPDYVAPAMVAPEFPAQPIEAEALELDMAQIADIPEMPPVEASEFEPAAQIIAPIVAESAAASTPAYVPEYHVPEYHVPEYKVQDVAAPVVAEPTPAIVPQQAYVPVAVDQPTPVSSPAENASLDTMLDRFETGLRRRQLQNLVAATSLDAPIPNANGTDAIADAALRDALGTLERLAANAR